MSFRVVLGLHVLHSGIVRFDLRQRGLVFIQGSKDVKRRGRLVAANGAGQNSLGFKLKVAIQDGCPQTFGGEELLQ